MYRWKKTSEKGNRKVYAGSEKLNARHLLNFEPLKLIVHAD